MISKSKLGRGAALGALALAVAAGCAKSEDGQAANAEPVTTNTPASTPEARTSNSETAISLLVAVAQARDALNRKDKAGALNHVNAALASLERIDSVPLVPIYAELSQQSFLAPVEAAKNTGGQPVAQNGARETGSAAEIGASMNTGSAPVAVRTVTSGYSRVLLDTSVTQTQLNAAKAALDRSDLRSADKALMTVEQSVVLETAVARMPLVRARENLSLAGAAARRNDWADAQVQLNAAARSLADFAKVAPAADLADVKIIQQQIAAYAPTVRDQHADAASRIDDWWTRLADLTDKEA